MLCMDKFMQTIFSHPDYTVGSGISPDLALRRADFTAGRDILPALKIQAQSRAFSSDTYIIHTHAMACNNFFHENDRPAKGAAAIISVYFSFSWERRVQPVTPSEVVTWARAFLISTRIISSPLSTVATTSVV